MDANKVSVRIYGQEYVIAGEESREHIMKVADHVDSKMHEIASHMSGPLSSVAVLAAVNIADEYISNIEGDVEARLENQKLKADKEHYIQLWEEAKKNFAQYQEDARSAQLKNVELKNTIEALKSELSEKDAKCKQDIATKEIEVKQRLAAKDAEIAELKKAANGLERKLDRAADNMEQAENAKFKELESSCFELEMENVQLKAEIERLKRQL